MENPLKQLPSFVDFSRRPTKDLESSELQTKIEKKRSSNDGVGTNQSPIIFENLPRLATSVGYTSESHVAFSLERVVIYQDMELNKENMKVWKLNTKRQVFLAGEILG